MYVEDKPLLVLHFIFCIFEYCGYGLSEGKHTILLDRTAPKPLLQQCSGAKTMPDCWSCGLVVSLILVFFETGLSAACCLHAHAPLNFNDYGCWYCGLVLVASLQLLCYLFLGFSISLESGDYAASGLQLNL